MNIQSYEAHVTIEPVYGERFEQFEKCCVVRGFRPAELFLQKSRQDTPIRSSKDSFCTGHGKDYSEINNRLLTLVNELETAGFMVWRYKIEGIVLDVRKERLVTIKEVA